MELSSEYLSTTPFDTVIKTIATTLRESWSDIPLSTILVSTLTGGITNALYMCRDQNNPDDRVLVRVYGEKTDLFIDREKEKVMICALHQCGFSKELFGCFYSETISGIAYGYQSGDVVCEDELKWPNRLMAVGKRVAELHLCRFDGGGDETNPKGDVLHWLTFVPELEEWDDAEKREKLICAVGSLEWIREEMMFISEELEKTNSPIVYCHNDLLAGNIIFDGEEVNFIDFEYGNFNHRSWDIANHFIECCGVDQIIEDFPTEEQRRIFLQSYYETYYKESPSESDLKSLDNEVLKFTLSSLLYWGTWGIIQTYHSLINFDFAYFTQRRFAHYKLKKDLYLSL